MVSLFEPTTLLALHSYWPPPVSATLVREREVEVSSDDMVMSGSALFSVVPLWVQVTESGGGTPSKEQDSCRVLPRGTSTRSWRSAVTSGATVCGGGGGRSERERRGGEQGGDPLVMVCLTYINIYVKVMSNGL